MQIGFKWNAPTDIILDRVTGGEKTLFFMANEAKRLMDPYVPYMDGVLSKNVEIGADSDGGFVHYKSPYAGFQFNGVVMLGVNSHSPYAKYGEGKVTTSKPLMHSKFRHPLATSYWYKAMKTARMNDLTKATQNYIRRYV